MTSLLCKATIRNSPDKKAMSSILVFRYKYSTNGGQTTLGTHNIEKFKCNSCIRGGVALVSLPRKEKKENWVLQQIT